jgi:hypothetical protein
MLFLPRRFRIICFCIVTPFEAGIILTANYTFLNYLVLSLGILLVDDKFLEAILPSRFRDFIARRDLPAWVIRLPANLRSAFSAVKMSVAGLALGMVFYVTSTILIEMFIPGIPFPEGPMRWLDPFRIANRYGLFANMTHERYEIEFQGTRDGKSWVPYPFRYKPQDLTSAPGIYAPYQPRFEWNLWFASLDSWRRSPFVVATEEQILKGSPDVLALFANDPFKGDPPKAVRAVIYQYWFTDLATKRTQGTWWRRDLLGRYCPAVIRTQDGEIAEDDSEDLSPTVHPPRE